MGILNRVFGIGLAALAGCYSPAVRDCTVSCASPSDCVSGQVCGGDGFCAAPAVAGRCGAAVLDARPVHDDAAGSDSSALVSLHVQISGKGSVVIENRGTCSSQDMQRTDCQYDIVLGVAQNVDALPIEPNQMFGSWTSETCNGQDESCTFTPVAATTIAARFEHN